MIMSMCVEILLLSVLSDNQGFTTVPASIETIVRFPVRKTEFAAISGRISVAYKLEIIAH